MRTSVWSRSLRLRRERVIVAATATLEAFQREFAAALFNEAASDAVGGLASQPGFAVYRNTVLRGCIDALAANYPTVAQLVGGDWFESAAVLFARSHLPREGGLASYGEGFAAFLEAFEPAGELPYLAGVARLDRAWTEAHIASDAPVLLAPTLAALAPQVLAGAVLVPHPAARWLTFESLPAFTIWRRHREALPLDDELAWRGESGLVVRPSGQVTWHALDLAGAAFLTACAQGLFFAEAAERAAAADADSTVPLGAWLSALIAAGAFTRVQIPSR